MQKQCSDVDELDSDSISSAFFAVPHILFPNHHHHLAKHAVLAADLWQYAAFARRPMSDAGLVTARPAAACKAFSCFEGYTANYKEPI